MIRSLTSIVAAGLIGLPQPVPAETPEERPCVVLLHGLGRTPASMKVMKWGLETKGFRVVNQGYPSTKAPVETLAAEALPTAITACGDAPEIHVVAHSMGGILLRHWLIENRETRLKRAVLLGPPNAGSEIPDRFGDWDLYGWINGPAGRQLKTDGLPARLPADPGIDVGVIAGSVSMNPLYSAVIGAPSDGKVSVASALAIAAHDQIVLPISHTWMMMRPDVIEMTARFLECGRFRPGA